MSAIKKNKWVYAAGAVALAGLIWWGYPYLLPVITEAEVGINEMTVGGAAGDSSAAHAVNCRVGLKKVCRIELVPKRSIEGYAIRPSTQGSSVQRMVRRRVCRMICPLRYDPQGGTTEAK